MKELICIICPKGCHLKVDINNSYNVSGNNCPKGIDYAKKELQNPERTLTSTVIIKNSPIKRLPVKTDKEIPKNEIFNVMSKLDNVYINAPVKRGDIILKNVLDADEDDNAINIVSCRTVSSVK